MHYYSNIIKVVVFIVSFTFLGVPEAPYLKNVKTYIKNFPNGDVSKVYADVEWIPGYDGGDDVWFVVYYGSQQSRIIYENHFTIKENLKANEDYVFYVKATNNYGPSKNTSNHVRQRTQGLSTFLFTFLMMKFMYVATAKC